MIKRLVAFGCSWTYGDELHDDTLQLSDSLQGQRRDLILHRYRLEHGFPGLLAQHFGLELENYGFPGASEESIRYTFNWYLENHSVNDCVILVAHTDPSRKSWFDTQQNDPEWNRFIHSPWLKTKNPDIDDNWYRLQKLWLGMSYHTSWVKNNFLETTRLFDWARLYYQIPVIQTKALVNALDPGTDNFFNPHSSLQEILKLENQPCYPGGHPTEQGHKILSKHLLNYIESANIL